MQILALGLRTPTTSRALASLGLIGLQACTQAAPTPDSDSDALAWPAGFLDAPSLDLEHVASYGWEDSIQSASAQHEAFAGGLIGRIGGLAEGPGGSVYVLDPTYYKVVVFAPDGTYQRRILGGNGSGPGEFQVPRSIAVAYDGTVAVLDENRRVTLFDPSGAYATSFTHSGPPPTHVAFRGNDVIVACWTYRAGRPLIMRYDRQGTLVDSLGRASEREAHLALYGEAGQLGPAPAGNVVWSSPAIGIWAAIDDTSFHRQGEELLPDVAGIDANYQGTAYKYVPFGPSGIGILPSGLRILHVLDLGSAPPVGEARRIRHVLAAFRPDGDVAGVHRFDGELQPLRLATSLQGDFVYLAFTDPYPHVRKYTVRTTGSAARQR